MPKTLVIFIWLAK